jgi:hypothetical protein
MTLDPKRNDNGHEIDEMASSKQELTVLIRLQLM